MNILVLLLCVVLLCAAEKKFLPIYTPSSDRELNEVLCNAACNGDANLIGFFHKHFPGAWRNATCESRSTHILEEAVMNGNGLAVRTLIVLGARLSNGRFGQTLLHLSAVSSKRQHALFELLDAGVDVDAVDSGGRTALLSALTSSPSHYGDLSQNVFELLAAGADPTKRDKFEIPPVAITMERRMLNDSVVATLLGASEIPDSSYRAYHCNFKNVFRYPLKYLGKTDVIDVGGDGREVVKRNLSIIQDYLLRTVLHKQMVPSNTLNKYAEIINSTDLFSRTPLHEAARLGNRRYVKGLLDLGADVHAKDWMGRTPLHLACLCHRPIVKDLLLKRGGNPSAVDKRNQTPQDLEQRL